MATAFLQRTRDYVDLDLNFNIHPIRKDINKHVGEIAVINSIKHLLLTNFYEKPFNPEYGSNIRGLLFENLDIVTSTAIEKEILNSIKNYEPRVTVDAISVNPDFDNNAFTIKLTFFVNNKTSPTSITFQLERIR